MNNSRTEEKIEQVIAVMDGWRSVASDSWKCPVVFIYTNRAYNSRVFQEAAMTVLLPHNGRRARQFGRDGIVYKFHDMQAAEEAASSIKRELGVNAEAMDALTEDARRKSNRGGLWYK